MLEFVRTIPTLKNVIMKITQVHIENFRSIENLTLQFPEAGILTLVGPNNAGKSNTIRAINNIIGESWFKGETADIIDFYNREQTRTIKIEITFNNGWSVAFDSSANWPEYKDENGSRITPYNIPEGSSGSVKEDFPCTYLPANRSLEDNLQFNSYRLMGKIAKSFNARAQVKKEQLEDKFNNIMDILNEVDEFKRFKEDFITYFDDMQSDSPYRLKVNFQAFTPLNYFKSINILANDSSINDQYDIAIEELGEGNKNLILFALVRSYAKNFRQEAQGLIALEEPEIYLHPQARRHLYNVLEEITNDSNIQVLVTTHSDSFVRTENFYQIGLVSKANNGTKIKRVEKSELLSFCTNTGAPIGRISASNIDKFYATTSNHKLNEAFFSKYLILVEGDTEEMAFPVYMKSSGVDCDFKGVSIIGVGGKSQVPKYWRLFKSFNIPILIVFDNDITKDNGQGNGLLATCFNCRKEDFIESIDIYKKLETSKQDVFEQSLIVLNGDFETAIEKELEQYCTDNNKENKYSEFVENAKSIINPTPGTQKGQMARFIAKSILREYPDFVPSFIKRICELIES